MKRQFLYSVLMTFAVILTSFTTALGQTTYTASPSGWTSVPSSNITGTPLTKTVTLHGNLLVGRAVISGSTVVFQVKKSDGSQFKNGVTVNLHENDVNGARKKRKSFSAGQSTLSLGEYELDFTSGSKKYCLTLCSTTSSGEEIWYYTNPITITATTSSQTTPSLEIAGGDYFGTNTLTKGKTYTFTIKVKNTGSSSWSGAFYLKNGSENVLDWYETISAGATRTLTGSYTPKTTGSQTLKLFYQTGGSGAGIEVPAGYYKNPFTVTVEDAQATPSLEIAGGDYFGTNTLTKGKAYTFTIKVKNTGSSAWTGALYLKDGSENVLDWYETISAGATRTLTGSYTPKTTGSQTLKLFYQTGGSGAGIAVPAGYYKNPFTVTVEEPQTTPSLEIAGGDYFGTNTLTKGKAYTFTIKVKNTGSAAWTGAFYLKNGSDNVLDWYETISAGATRTLTGSYTPKTTGSLSLKLFYQTGGSGAGIEVPAGYYKNPFTVTVEEPQTTPSLEIAGGDYFGTNTLTKGKAYTFTIKVKNTGSAAWSGAFYLKNGSDNVLDWYETISAGATRTLTGSYTPMVTGSLSLKLYYQTGGSGEGIAVPAGYYKNPFTISITDGQSTIVLDHPDNASLKATQVDATSFRANWDNAEGATSYNVLLKKAGSSDNSFMKKGYGTKERPYCTFAGLTPNTTYQFQVQSSNGSTTSTYSKFCSVTTLGVDEQKDDLRIYLNNGIIENKPLQVGKSYKYNLGVKNDGSKPWKGSLILKDGSQEVYSWNNIDLSVGGGKAFAVNYVPKEAGTHTFCLYYRTGGVGKETTVSSGDKPNPITVSVAGESLCPLILSQDIRVTAPAMKTGETFKITATIANSDSKAWEGTLSFTMKGVPFYTTSLLTIPAGDTKTISTIWNPVKAQTYEIGVGYKDKDSNSDVQPVPSNGYPNPMSVTVADAETEIPASVRIELASSGLYPDQVRVGSVINYFYRITDKLGHPVPNVKALFRCSGDYSGTLETPYSGANGIVCLNIDTSKDYPIVSSGQTVLFEVAGIHHKNGSQLPIMDAGQVTQLRMHNSNTFENIEKTSISLDLGVKAKADAGIVGIEGNATIPLKLTMSYDDNGNISSYKSSVGLKADIKAKAEYEIDTDLLGKHKLFKIAGSLGGGVGGEYSNTYNSWGDLATHSVIKLCQVHTTTTSSALDFAVKTVLNWYYKRHKITERASWYWSVNAGISLTDDNSSYTLQLPDDERCLTFANYHFEELSGDLKANFKYTPNIWNKEVGIKNTYGEAASMTYSASIGKKQGTTEMAKMDPDYGDKFWNIAGYGNYAQNFMAKYMQVGKVGADAEAEFSFDREEMYNDEAKKDIYSLSQSLSNSFSTSLSLDELPNPFVDKKTHDNDKSLKLTGKTTFKKKQESKGLFASYLKECYTYDLFGTHRALAKAVYPAFSWKELINPLEMYNFWKDTETIEPALEQLVSIIGNPEKYSLKDVLKIEQSKSLSGSATLTVPICNWKIVKLSFTLKMGLGVDFRPSQSYYSIKDRCFFPTILQPSSTIKEIAQGLINDLSNGIKSAFADDKDREKEIEAEGEALQHTEYKDVQNEVINFDYGDYERSDYMQQPAVARRARARHANLLQLPQTDICTLGFVLNEQEQNFNEGTKMTFSHFYPAGDLFAITDKNDTLFVVSEVTSLTATEDDVDMEKAKQGRFRLNTYIGKDDLKPFGLAENLPLDIYHAKKGSDVWHYVGPAGTPIMVDSLGEYILATPLASDVTAPNIEMNFDVTNKLLYLAISDNIGVRTQSLQVMICGESRDIEQLNDQNYVVKLTDDDMQYLVEAYATVYDIAGNQGSASQMFNLNMPQRPSQSTTPEDIDMTDMTDISALENVLYIEPTEVRTGNEAELSIKMKNAVEAEGFGFDLYLPVGLTFKTDADGFPETYLSTERTTARKTNTFESVIRPDGALRVMAASTNGSVFSGNDGEVATVKILVDENAPQGILPIILRQIAISDSEARSYDTDFVKSYVRVIDGTVDIQTLYTSRQTRPADNNIYNIQGQRVASPTAPGIYIKNGRKFVVR